MPKILVRIHADVRDIAPAYLESRKRDLGALKDAATRKDFEFIWQLAHKTKGTAGGYGFEALGPIAKSLEIAAKAENSIEVMAALEQMSRYLADVEIAD